MPSVFENHNDNAAGPTSLDDAVDFIKTAYSPVVGTELVDLNLCEGRRLVHAINSIGNLPYFSAAAMDGFAIRSEDIDGQKPVALRIRGSASAGHPYAEVLGPGDACAISTGAVVPEGADRVVRSEDCKIAGDAVYVKADLQAKPHIRKPGEDVKIGQLLLKAGTRLGPRHLGLLNALQIKTVQVFKRLRVALMSSGDELRETTDPLSDGHIIDSNRPYLRACLRALGCEVLDLGIIPDDPEQILHALISAACDCDLIVTSGSASIGSTDVMSKLIRRRGYLEFWRLALRPGKPVGLGDIDDCPILSLPGNPFAAATGFAFLGRPLIGRLCADDSLLDDGMWLPLTGDVPCRKGFAEIRGAALGLCANGSRGVTVLPAMGSANLAALAASEGFALLPDRDGTLYAGDLVKFVPN